MVTRPARSVAEVGAAYGVKWPTAHAAFVEHADALLSDPEPTKVLGIDETRRGKLSWVTAHPRHDGRDLVTEIEAILDTRITNARTEV